MILRLKTNFHWLFVNCADFRYQRSREINLDRSGNKTWATPGSSLLMRKPFVAVVAHGCCSAIRNVFHILKVHIVNSLNAKGFNRGVENYPTSNLKKRNISEVSIRIS